MGVEFDLLGGFLLWVEFDPSSWGEQTEYLCVMCVHILVQIASTMVVLYQEWYLPGLRALLSVGFFTKFSVQDPSDCSCTEALWVPLQTLWRCYAAEKSCTSTATWKIYVTAPVQNPKKSPAPSSPGLRKQVTALAGLALCLLFILNYNSLAKNLVKGLCCLDTWNMFIFLLPHPN